MGFTGDGVIYRSVQYAVWCATCDAVLDYASYKNKERAAKAYRQQGWQNTKLGWRCDICCNASRKPRRANGSE
jgi:hypothetical protein